MNTRHPMIIIKGEIKTSEVKYCEYSHNSHNGKYSLILTRHIVMYMIMLRSYLIPRHWNRAGIRLAGMDAFF